MVIVDWSSGHLLTDIMAWLEKVYWALRVLFVWSFVSWFLGFSLFDCLVSWFLLFLGFLVSKIINVSWFLGFKNSKFQRFHDPILPSFHVMFLIDIDLISTIFKICLHGASGFSGTRLLGNFEMLDSQSFETSLLAQNRKSSFEWFPVLATCSMCKSPYRRPIQKKTTLE